jgi:hypothetical protein
MLPVPPPASTRILVSANFPRVMPLLAHAAKCWEMDICPHNSMHGHARSCGDWPGQKTFHAERLDSHLFLVAENPPQQLNNPGHSLGSVGAGAQRHGVQSASLEHMSRSAAGAEVDPPAPITPPAAWTPPPPATPPDAEVAPPAAATCHATKGRRPPCAASKKSRARASAAQKEDQDRSDQERSTVTHRASILRLVACNRAFGKC